jgi:tRNA(Ile)-lysidine synthase
VLQREIDILHNDEEFIQEKVQKVFNKLVTKGKKGLTIDLRHLLYYNKAIGNRVLINVIKNLKGNLTGLESKHIDAILSLNDKISGKKIFLPGNLCAQRLYESVVICPSASEKEKDFLIPVKVGKAVEIGNLRLKASFVAKITQVYFSENCEFFDFGELIPPFFLRNWKPGDILEIKKGRKKIKKILNEARVPVSERGSILLLCDQRGILWVVGICRAYRAFIDRKTRNILKVEFEYIN